MLNRYEVIGILGADPEVRYLESGSVVASFSVATSFKYKDKDGNKKEVTDWHNVVLWDGLAKVADQYLKKGQLVFVSGSHKTRSYEDKDGVKKYTSELAGREMKMLTSKGEGGSRPAPDAPTPEQSNDSNIDDLPF